VTLSAFCPLEFCFVWHYQPAGRLAAQADCHGPQVVHHLVLFRSLLWVIWLKFTG